MHGDCVKNPTLLTDIIQELRKLTISVSGLVDGDEDIRNTDLADIKSGIIAGNSRLESIESHLFDCES